MDKKREINFNLNNFLLSISKGIDYKTKEYFNFEENYSKRVAYVALNIGRCLNLDPKEMADLCSLSLSHAIAVCETDKLDDFFYEKSIKILKDFPFLTDNLNSLNEIKQFKNHSTIVSQILSFSIFLNQKFDFSKYDLNLKNSVCNYLEENKDNFEEFIVDTFLENCSQNSYWYDLENENEILYFIYGNLHDFTEIITFEKLLEISYSIHIAINRESNLLLLCDKAVKFYKFEHKDDLTFKIAATFATLGKLAISDKILKKESSLDEFEYEQIKIYPYITKQLLSNIMGLNDILTWAVRVQESLDGSGYPYSLEASNLSLKDRLLKVLIIFNSLTTKQTFRDALSYDDAIITLNQLSQKNIVDLSVVEDLKKYIK